MKVKLFGIGAALLAVAAVAYAADTFNLKRVPKVGQTYTYTLKAEIVLEGQNVEFRGEQVEKVIEVKEGGLYVVEQGMVNALAIFGGQEIPVPEMPPSRVTMRTNGEIVEIQSEAGDPDAHRVANMMGFRLDRDAYRVGDKWTVEVPGNAEKGILRSRVEVEILARERVLGIDSIKIKTKSTELEGSTPVSVEGTSWIDPTDGSLVKAELSVTNMPMMGMVVQGKFTIERKL